MSAPAHQAWLFLFETTHLAMWAEEVALKSGIPAEVVSAPPEAKDKCGLALRTRAEDGPRLEAAMTSEGIEYSKAAAEID